MISHVVCFKMKPFALGKQKKDNLTILKEKVENLKKIIPLVKALNFEFTESGEYEAVAVMLFDSHADLEAYEENPDHIAVKNFISEVCIKMEVVNSEI